jgi:hypothetical protein
MTDTCRTDLLAEAFEAQRDRLSAVAYRVLGSHADAEDVVQEAWMRLARQDATTRVPSAKLFGLRQLVRGTYAGSPPRNDRIVEVTPWPANSRGRRRGRGVCRRSAFRTAHRVPPHRPNRREGNRRNISLGRPRATYPVSPIGIVPLLVLFVHSSFFLGGLVGKSLVVLLGFLVLRAYLRISFMYGVAA